MMNWFKKLFRSQPKEVIIVSGLPRSGTSMMMRMLEAGGIDVLVDHIRKPNEDNPKGYYEFERVKKLPEGDIAWLNSARGRVVKIIAALLQHLPAMYTYKVLFMRRDIDEILASQKQMLVRRGQETDKVDDAEMAQLFEHHLVEVYAWMDQQSNLSYFDVNYNAVLADPQPIAEQIQQFLGWDLDIEAMVAMVDPQLYRQRHS
jgi:hypothetical protein